MTTGLWSSWNAEQMTEEEGIMQEDLDLFSSAAFGGKDLIFSDSTSELVELAKSMDSFIYLGQNYYKAMRALKVGNPPPTLKDRSIEWCTISHAEQQKCDKLNSKIPRIACKRESSVEECFKKIMRREADAIAVDGGQVYMAVKCGLVPVMVEQYNQQSCGDGGETEASSYYVVAVVRKGSGVTWNNLKGRKSCHTGLNRNAGWKVPDSAICGKTPDCTLYKFFSKGCAPGADPQSNMCELCKGSGKAVGDENKCKASSGEIYYGYDGAFRCLAEKTGEVAFIKHTIVGDYTDGKGPEWAKDLKSDEFELICPETPGQTVEHTAFAKCNLARVPAHAVITFEDARTDVVNVLKQAQANSEVQLFKSEGERNLLFTDSTKCLQENTKSLVDFMTQKYIDMIERTYETGQSKPDVMFLDSVSKLTVLPRSTDSFLYLKEDYYKAMQALAAPAYAVITWEDACADVVNVLTQAQASSDDMFKSEDVRNLLCLQRTPEQSQSQTDIIKSIYAIGRGLTDLMNACALSFCTEFLTEIHTKFRPFELCLEQ
ncbi:transferrin variant C [Labeo rohita]|uniref:Transferrin variant C n=1 Tax=Labeo rohita TaxID=84645 RepID=A0A498N218_LABRO|nr:transferrin variant C [Labeo rohita]